MTWAGVNKKHYMSELDVNNRVPNPKYMEHYEFELEVLAVNETKGLKEIVKTIIVWAGLTYGFEQDLLQFAFDSACKTTDIFPIPSSQNHLPVIHVEDLARVIHKVISDDQALEYHYIFAVESPINTLKQIITALAKSCDVAPVVVPLNTFMNKYELKREEIRLLYYKSQFTQDSEDLLDDADDQAEISPIITNKISELNKKLSMLYSSMDANNDELEDIYLIPLLNERIALFKRGYVLDGYPTTVDQAKMLFRFDDTNLLQSNIDINKLPDLTVNLTQNAEGDILPTEQNSEIHTNTNTNTLKNESAKRRLLFSEVDIIHSSNSDVAVVSNVVAAKAILKKQIKKKP
ncbi:unnamed protein product [Macrosiphum euphorbiae]|uniref:Uncharacterized protein n=1 Tax=Macrosiphum euphorbiae TaxID=13131 RepID=A0AAV0Y108_9HEMI|nr:unnamed protein product [Macrosiphum euphorbiae]